LEGSNTAPERRKTTFWIIFGRQIAAVERSQPIDLGMLPSVRSAWSVAVFSNQR
jgi:hypothetical protein